MKKAILLCAVLAFNNGLSAAESKANSAEPKASTEATAPQTKSSSEVVAASVNGTPIMKSVVDQIVKTYVAQGQKDTLQLRQNILDNLINRQILAQESIRQGLDKSAGAKNQLDLLKTNFLASLVLNEQVEKNPVKDADLKPEYDKQVKALGNASDLFQYKISHIVLPSEAEAREALEKIKKGDSINQLALQYSGNKNKGDDGSVDWILPNQILPEISNVMVNLVKGSVSVAPIYSNGGWHIIKLEDKRAFKVPTFEESKNNIHTGLIQKKQTDYLIQLRKNAKIQIQ